MVWVGTLPLVQSRARIALRGKTLLFQELQLAWTGTLDIMQWPRDRDCVLNVRLELTNLVMVPRDVFGAQQGKPNPQLVALCATQFVGRQVDILGVDSRNVNGAHQVHMLKKNLLL